MKLENVTIEWNKAQKRMMITVAENSEAERLLLAQEAGDSLIDGYSLSFYVKPKQRQPNLHPGAIVCPCGKCDTRWISASDDSVNLLGDDVFIHAPPQVRTQARSYEHNVVATSGKEAHFSGDATLSSGGCGYCSKQELFLNGRSLSSIVAFIQETDPCLCEPFQVTIDIRPAPQKD